LELKRAKVGSNIWDTMYTRQVGAKLFAARVTFSAFSASNGFMHHILCCLGLLWMQIRICLI